MFENKNLSNRLLAIKIRGTTVFLSAPDHLAVMTHPMKHFYVCHDLGLCLLLLGVSISLPLVAQGKGNSTSVVSLLDDTRFERGFHVFSPVAESRVVERAMQPNGSSPAPLWDLVQWHSRFTLSKASKELLPNGSVRFADGAKAVTFFPPEAEADVSFAVDGSIEFDGHASKPGDPWPHLLAERSLLSHPALAEMKSLPFAIRYRLAKGEVTHPPGFDATFHSAQFTLYLIVQNLNQESAGFNDYFWFGIPMYDARYRLPVAHKAIDVGSDKKPATGKFIFNPAGKRYTTQSAHDGDWVVIEKDLLPMIREGLETAWQRGYLQDSHEMSDYRLSAMNVGWEVTGPWNVEMQVAGLRLEAIMKTD